MTIKIYNKGERTFDLNGGRLEPKQIGEFDPEYGKQLLAMYPEELQDQASVTRKFDTESAKFNAPADYVAPVDADKVLADAKAQAEKIIADAQAEAAKIKDVEDKDGVKASKAARDLAEANGVDLKTITGTGDSGSITKPDVQAAIDAKITQ